MVGPFCEVDGYKYVCHYTCFATGFNFCFPTKDKEAVTVAAGLHKHVFMLAGWPRKLVSDQGGEFCNKLAEMLAASLWAALVHSVQHVVQKNTMSAGRVARPASQSMLQPPSVA